MAKGNRAPGSAGRSSVWIIVGLLGGVVLAGCTGLGGVAPDQSFKDAVQAFAAARMVHMEGQVKQGDTAYTVNLSLDGNDLDGAVIVQDMPVLVQKAGGRLFLRGEKYFQSQGMVTLSRWVLAPHGGLTDVVRKLIDRSDLTAALLAGTSGSVQRKEGPVIAGQKTDELAGSAVSVFEPGSGKQRPLRFQTVGGRELQDHLKDLKLDLTYDRPVHVEVPAKFVDPDNANTLPVRFVTVPDTFSFDDCDPTGCMLSTEVRNDGGRDGLANATFRVRQKGSEVASCKADVPIIGHGESTRVGCRANYDRHTDSSATVAIDNLLP